MQSAKCSASVPPFAKQKAEFGEEAGAAILPGVSRPSSAMAGLSAHPPPPSTKGSQLKNKHGRTLGGQIKEIFYQ